MKARIILVLIGSLLVFTSCRDSKRYHDKDKVQIEFATGVLGQIDSFQQKLNADFRDPEISPLPDRYRKNFTGLDFFKPDTSYRVMAEIELTPEAVPFLMPTTTSRKSKEVVYGIARFELKGKSYELEIYQNTDLMQDEQFKDYLFLPFLDETNGEETYGGGRYIDLSIPNGDSILIDFNMAYNPYCAYNKKYSCPIVPKVNRLNTRIPVGVMAFNK